MTVNSDFSKDKHIILKNDVLYYINENLPSNGSNRLVKTNCDIYPDKLYHMTKILCFHNVKRN